MKRLEEVIGVRGLSLSGPDVPTARVALAGVTETIQGHSTKRAQSDADFLVSSRRLW
jgi:hypothetical protein